MQVPRGGGRGVRPAGGRLLNARSTGAPFAGGETASVTLLGKPLQIHLSRAARSALLARTEPLLVEMELYFSCLIRKRVRFRECCADTDTVTVETKLQVRFHPVMTERCGTDYEGDEPPLTDFPIARPEAFVPHWLHIDHRNGSWQGEFGYD